MRQHSNCFTVNVPAWYRTTPTEDITEPGIPSDPDWKNLDAIVALQEEVLSDLTQGALAWRCNYELDPAIGGGRIFPAGLVDASDWVPYRDAKVTLGKEWPARIKYTAKGEVERFENGKAKMLAFDPENLYKVTACDQSFSENGDEWAVGTVGCDQWGHRYVLEMTTGHNMGKHVGDDELPMLDALLTQLLVWKPHRIGQEKIAAAHLIELVMKLDTKYRRLRSFLEAISHNNLAKDYRIRNYVAELMKMGRLHLNPHDLETKEEMKKYKPGKNAKDDRLDVLAMCEVLIQKSAQKDGEDDYRKKFQRSNQRIRSRRDQSTGVRVA